VRLEPLRRLAAIAGGPAAAVDLAKDVFSRNGPVLDLDVLEHPVSKAELAGQHVHGVVVVLRFKDRLDDLLAPLQRAIRGRPRTIHLEAGTGRQKIDAVLPFREHRPRRRIGIAYDQQFELFDSSLSFRHSGDGVDAMTHDEHRLHVVGLRHLILRQQRSVKPARTRDTRPFHQRLAAEP
jgi:hypothetical protein